MIKKLLKFPYCAILVFGIAFLIVLCGKAHGGQNWKWILTNVYWNQAGGQVCEFKQIGGTHYRRIVRQRGYGCPNKSMNPYLEP